MKVCVLGSSSSGNATAVWTRNTALLIDAGFTARELERRLRGIDLSPDRFRGILISHEHSDHIRGASVFSRRYEIPVFANRATFGLSRGLQDVYEKQYFRSHEDFEIGDLCITPLVVPHDASEPNAFVIRQKRKKVSIATDLGRHTPVFLDLAYDSNLIVLESNYDTQMLLEGDYPFVLKERIQSDFGHLSNLAAAKTLKDVIGESTENVLLAHLSQNNNTPDLAFKAAWGEVREFKGVNLGLTYPQRCSEVITV